MPAAQDISEALIRDFINHAIGHVFKTMVGRAPTFSASEGIVRGCTPHVEANRPQVVGTVGFVGECSGMVYLHLDLGFARACTCHLLGMTEPELDAAGDDPINDAIGELTNMTVGSFKNRLCDAGYPCKLTIPSILRGSSLKIQPMSSAVRHIYHFDCAEHRLIADILIKQDE